jgi:uncharacterized protein (TIGR03067 family)
LADCHENLLVAIFLLSCETLIQQKQTAGNSCFVSGNLQAAIRQTMKNIFIATLVLLCSFCKSQTQNNKLYGTWICERHGLSDSIAFQTNGILKMYYDGQAMTGDSIDNAGKKMKSSFVIDYSKNPTWIDIQYVDLMTNKIVETTRGIAKFLSNDKLMLRFPFDKDAPRPTEFDYENPQGETMIYYMESENRKK